MKATVLGFTVPDEDMQQILSDDAHMPIQTHSFAWAVVRALRSAGVDMTLLSSDPISSYPGNPSVVAHGGSFIAYGVRGTKLPFVNLVVLKHVTRFIACLRTGSRSLRSWRPDILLVHGVHSPFLLYGLLCRRFLGVPVVVILTDPPGTTLPSDSVVVRQLKRLDVGLVRTLLRGFDGVIALTEALAKTFAPKAASLIMEGIVDALPDLQGPTRSLRPRVLYAGGLTAAYGADRLVAAVRSLPLSDVRLSTYGRGDLVDWISAMAQADPRIETPRFASRDEVLVEYQRSDVLVQPRPVDGDFVPFSFPSKLLEYLASGTAVVSTRLAGIPADYEEHVYWAEDDSARGLAEAIADALAAPRSERYERASRAREFIWATRGSEAQGRRMADFLAQLLAAVKP